MPPSRSRSSRTAAEAAGREGLASMHYNLPSAPEGGPLVIRGQAGRGEQRHNRDGLQQRHEASQQLMTDPPAAPVRQDDHVLDVRAHNAVRHGPGETHQVLPVPRPHRRRKHQHRIDLLRRALGPPFGGPVQCEHTRSWNLARLMRQHDRNAAVRHTHRF